MNIPQEFEDVFHGVELTEDEIRTLTWIAGWESQTVENLRSAIQKAQATALSTLQAENESLRVLAELGNMRAKDYKVMRDRAVKAEAANSQLDGNVTTLMESNKKLADALREAEARAELAERERNAAVKLCGKLMALCSPPKEWEPKLFRPCIKRPGDYMGSGYAFLDSFNRIVDEFTETADEETYRAIREASEQEILDRMHRMIGQKEG